MALLKLLLLSFALSAGAVVDRTERRTPPDLSSAQSIQRLAGEMGSAHWRFDPAVGGELLDRFHARRPDGDPLPLQDRVALVSAMRQWMIEAATQSRERPDRFDELARTLYNVLSGTYFFLNAREMADLPSAELAPGILGAYETFSARQDLLSTETWGLFNAAMSQILGRSDEARSRALQPAVLGLMARRPYVQRQLAEIVEDAADDPTRDPQIRFMAEQARFYIRMQQPAGR